MLCGSAELIEEAWRYKQMWGGALRQAGVLAAACLYALDHHVDRLAEDHENAKLLARGLGLPEPDDQHRHLPERPDAGELKAKLAEHGVESSVVAPGRLRFVTHLDVDRAGIERADRGVRGVRRLLIALSGAVARSPGFAVAMLIFVLGLISGFDNDKYGKVPLPGEGRVTLPKGEVTVFYEERGELPRRPGVVHGALRPTPGGRCPAGPPAAPPTRSTTSTARASTSSTCPSEGEYLVRRPRQAGAFDQPALTFGPGIKFGTIAVRSLAAIGIGLVLCVLFALLARAFRRKPTRRPVPPPHSSAPMAAWQMPPPPPPQASADPQAELQRWRTTADGPHRRGGVPGPAAADPRPDLTEAHC